MRTLTAIAVFAAATMGCEKNQETATEPAAESKVETVPGGGGATAVKPAGGDSAAKPATSSDRDHKDFAAISAHGAVDVTLTQGPTFAVTLEGPEKSVAKTVTEVKDGTLHIYCEDKKAERECRGIVALVTLPVVKGVTVAGAGDIESTGPISGDELRLSISGAGDATLDVAVTKLTLTISGSGKGKLKGKADTALWTVSGAGKVFAGNLATKTSVVNINGAGSADVNASDSLKVMVSGAGSVTYSGDAKVEKKVSGAGSVTKK